MICCDELNAASASKHGQYCGLIHDTGGISSSKWHKSMGGLDRERTFLQGSCGLTHTPMLQVGRKRQAAQKEDRPVVRPGMHMTIGSDLPKATGLVQQIVVPGNGRPRAKRVRSLVGPFLNYSPSRSHLSSACLR